MNKQESAPTAAELLANAARFRELADTLSELFHAAGGAEWHDAPKS